MTARYHGQVSKQTILQALKQAKGKVRVAAIELGLPETTLRNWISEVESFKKVVAKLRATQSITKPAAVKVKPVSLEQAKPDTKLKLKKKQSKFVVTCAQNNTPIHQAFVNALLNYCEANNAQLIVIPIRYKNVTAYTQGEDYTPWWPEALKPYYLNDEYHLNENLVILGDLKIQATATDPLSSITNIAKSKSAIIGHPQLALKMIPTPLSELPRQLVTTGSCSQKNYSTSKAGHLAAFNHTFGATVVEVDGDLFFTRQINATDDGSFYDLDGFYSHDQVTRGHRAAGLVCGDLHVDFVDPGVVAATWQDKDSIVNICQPEHEFYHDVLDFYSANHWHRGKMYTNFAKHHAGKTSIESELQRVVQFHNTYLSGRNSFIHYIPSNHNDHLTRWLQEVDIRLDPENALLYHELQLHMLKNTKMTANGTIHPDPLEFYLKQYIVNGGETFFHNRDERVNLHGIDLSQHGDKGPNGSRGTLAAFSRTGYKIVIGHIHTPGIWKGAYGVGTSSRLKLEYNGGYSSWLHTHCLIYPNGKRTLINIINGKWRA